MVDKNKNVCLASIKMLSHYCLWIIIAGSVLTGSPYLKMRPGCFFSVAPCATQTLRNQILKHRDPARVVKGLVYENHGLGLKQTPSINCFAAHNQILIRSRGNHWVWSLNITTFDGLSWRLLLKCSETVPCKDEFQLLGPRATSSFPMAKRLAMSRVFCLSGLFHQGHRHQFCWIYKDDTVVCFFCHVIYWWLLHVAQYFLRPQLSSIRYWNKWLRWWILCLFRERSILQQGHPFLLVRLLKSHSCTV